MIMVTSSFFEKIRLQNVFSPYFGTVYTDAVSLLTVKVSMLLHLSFTRRRFEFVIRNGLF